MEYLHCCLFLSKWGLLTILALLAYFVTLVVVLSRVEPFVVRLRYELELPLLSVVLRQEKP